MDSRGAADTYRYDAVGNEIAASFANGASSRKSYDALDPMTAIVNLDARGKSASGFAYRYDALGNVASERAGRGGDDGRDEEERGTIYGYDALSRLVSVGGDDKRQTFRYDPVGNRIGVSGDDRDGATSATFDAADQLTSLVNKKGRVVAPSRSSNGYLNHWPPARTSRPLKWALRRGSSVGRAMV